jgi:hypothetical protein
MFNAEKDVEAFFRSILEKQTKTKFITEKGKGWQTDGIIKWQGPNGEISLLLEAKFNKDLTDTKIRSNVIAQVLYYYNRLKQAGKVLPSFILIGDETYSFLLKFSSIDSYLSLDIDWSRPPSSPDPELKIEIDVFLYKTSELSGLELKKQCEILSTDTTVKIKPSEENLSAMYQYWVDHIFPKDKYSSIERAHIFYSCICYSEKDHNCAYPHPTKKDTLVIDSKEYQLLLSVMNGFFSQVQRGLSAIEIDALVSMRDTIIEDDIRRRQGAFYTPTLWVEEAHLQIEKILGENWKDECIVWDCCAGTGNLTRDYDFSNLIISTAELTDIQLIKREGYNENAQIFQYDFLNPEAESPFFAEENGDNVLPLAVKKLLKEGAKAGKRLVFLINPPYATAGNAGAKGTAKAGVAQTIVNKEMKKAKLGACSQQLYSQFLYQCEQLASEYAFEQKSIGVFCKPAFMTTGSFAKFRPFWYEKYSYQSGFLFQASHFANVSGAWAVCFTLWSEGETDLKQDLPVTLKDLEDGSVISLGNKTLYASCGREATKWVKKPVKGLKTYDAPQMKSGLSLKTKGVLRGREVKGSLLYFTNNANCPQENQRVYFTSHCSPNGHGATSVLAGESWRRAISLYSARKLVKGNWVNDKDEYLAPHADFEGYDQWVDDCHIYALLHNSNNITAMRNIEYKNVNYNIHNHFFWLTRKEAIQLYGNNRETRSLYRDVKKNPIPFIPETENGLDVTPLWRKNGDPYFSFVLPNLNLSPLAVEILKDLNQLFVDSLPLRKQVTHVNSLNLHLEAWDAGVYQLKKFWYTNPNLKEKWEALRLKHLRLANQLQPGVYKYGFLKN